jgi:hypothetical protein
MEFALQTIVTTAILSWLSQQDETANPTVSQQKNTDNQPSHDLTR